MSGPASSSALHDNQGRDSVGQASTGGGNGRDMAGQAQDGGPGRPAHPQGADVQAVTSLDKQSKPKCHRPDAAQQAVATGEPAQPVQGSAAVKELIRRTHAKERGHLELAGIYQQQADRIKTLSQTLSTAQKVTLATSVSQQLGHEGGGERRAIGAARDPRVEQRAPKATAACSLAVRDQRSVTAACGAVAKSQTAKFTAPPLSGPHTSSTTRTHPARSFKAPPLTDLQRCILAVKSDSFEPGLESDVKWPAMSMRKAMRNHARSMIVYLKGIDIRSDQDQLVRARVKPVGQSKQATVSVVDNVAVAAMSHDIAYRSTQEAFLATTNQPIPADMPAVLQLQLNFDGLKWHAARCASRLHCIPFKRYVCSLVKDGCVVTSGQRRPCCQRW